MKIKLSVERCANTGKLCSTVLQDGTDCGCGPCVKYRAENVAAQIAVEEDRINVMPNSLDDEQTAEQDHETESQ